MHNYLFVQTICMLAKTKWTYYETMGQLFLLLRFLKELLKVDGLTLFYGIWTITIFVVPKHSTMVNFNLQDKKLSRNYFEFKIFKIIIELCSDSSVKPLKANSIVEDSTSIRKRLRHVERGKVSFLIDLQSSGIMPGNAITQLLKREADFLNLVESDSITGNLRFVYILQAFRYD